MRGGHGSSGGCEDQGVGSGGDNHDFPEHRAPPERGEGGRRVGERERSVEGGAKASGGRPFQGSDHVGAVASVAADQALLFDEEGPEVERDLASGGGAAGDDGAVAGEAFEASFEDTAAHVFDDEVNAASAGELADLGGPVVAAGVDGVVGAEFEGERAFGFRGTGGDDGGAEGFGDGDGGGADAAGGAHHEDGLAGLDAGAVVEHVHGGAAGEGERSGGLEAHGVRQADEGAGRNEDLLGKAAVPLDPEELAMQADGFLPGLAKLTGAAEQIRLNGHPVAGLPVGNAGSDGPNLAGGFAALGEGQGKREGETGLLGPEIQPVQPAGADVHDGVAGAGGGVGDVAEGMLAGVPVGEELEGFHGFGAGASVMARWRVGASVVGRSGDARAGRGRIGGGADGSAGQGAGACGTLGP